MKPDLHKIGLFLCPMIFRNWLMNAIIIRRNINSASKNAHPNINGILPLFFYD